MIVAGASAYPREINHDRFAEIARDVGAQADGGDMAHYAGLVAAVCTIIPFHAPTTYIDHPTKRFVVPVVV